MTTQGTCKDCELFYEDEFADSVDEKFRCGHQAAYFFEENPKPHDKCHVVGFTPKPKEGGEG